MAPVVAAAVAVGVRGVAVLLLLGDEGPLLIELDLAGLGGEKATNSSWVALAC
jgi:hypothetical protein